MRRDVDESPADLTGTPRADQRGRRDVATIADDHIPSVLDLRQEGDDLRWGVREVGVGEHHSASRCHQHASADRGTFSPILRLDEHDICTSSARLRRGVVTRTVVDHDDLDATIVVHGREVAS